MKSRTHGTGTTWALDGETITVFIPMTWKRRGGQKVIIAPDGSDAWAPAKARPDQTLIRALARAHRWNRMLEAGKCRSITEIAEAEKIGRSFVSRLLRLTLLAPDIQRRSSTAPQPKAMQLEELTKAMPGTWEEQRRFLPREYLRRVNDRAPDTLFECHGSAHPQASRLNPRAKLSSPPSPHETLGVGFTTCTLSGYNASADGQSVQVECGYGGEKACKAKQ